MNGLLLTLHLSVSILIIFIVLSQVGRGAELGAAFGSAGQANSPRTVGNFLTKLTTWLATIFMLTSITLSVMTARQANNSVLNAVSEKQVKTVETTKDKNTATKATDTKAKATKAKAATVDTKAKAKPATVDTKAKATKETKPKKK